MTHNIRVDRDKARKLIESGLTNVEVAQALNCTKQLIPELKHELGLPVASRRPRSTWKTRRADERHSPNYRGNVVTHPSSRVIAQSQTCAEKRARKERVRAPEPDLPLAVIPRRRKAPEPAWTGTPVTLAEIGQGQCRYIVGEVNGANTPMCGAPSGHGVWCAEHLVRVSDRRKTEESRATA